VSEADWRYEPAVRFLAARLGLHGNGAMIVPRSLANEAECRWPGFLDYCAQNGYLRGYTQPTWRLA
jgi:hypothetical protein